MNRYLNGMLTNEKVIEELLKLTKDIAAAFYDALTKPQAIKDFYEHEELIAITKELTHLLRKTAPSTGRKKKAPELGCAGW